MITGVIFDMDGLIFDTERLYFKFWQQAGICFGYDIPVSTLLNTIGKNEQKTKHILLNVLGFHFPYDAVRRLRDNEINEYIINNGVPIKSGFWELYHYCKNNALPIGLATSTSESDASYLLSRAGLRDHFDCITFGSDVSLSKPHPEIYLKTCLKLDSPPCRTFALEDSESGILSAYRAGTIPVFVPDMIRTSSIISKYASHEVAELNHVINLIDNYRTFNQMKSRD